VIRLHLERSAKPRCDTQNFLRENGMNTFCATVPAIAACIVKCCVSPAHARAQTGVAVTKQTQDTQRAAQKKTRKANTGTHDNVKKENEMPPAPASGTR
jgi:hypothetical protein